VRVITESLDEQLKAADVARRLGDGSVLILLTREEVQLLHVLFGFWGFVWERTLANYGTETKTSMGIAVPLGASGGLNASEWFFPLGRVYNGQPPYKETTA
jgi:hypothetical protein